MSGNVFSVFYPCERYSILVKLPLPQGDYFISLWVLMIIPFTSSFRPTITCKSCFAASPGFLYFSYVSSTSLYFAHYYDIH